MLTKPMEDLVGPKSIEISLEGVVDETENMSGVRGRSALFQEGSLRL